ncbi:lecithin retinol acyltransferase-like [Pomacea canaliculata]|uniref:lecithin retinol acyltransferase-like n=1 Tax=Pomacea canaliculata TaxID=400727 RepID=UPI000D73F5C6|nr:lecithin retinol acyltransferase-like [Pomacea canaliculata]
MSDDVLIFGGSIRERSDRTPAGQLYNEHHAGVKFRVGLQIRHLLNFITHRITQCGQSTFFDIALKANNNHEHLRDCQLTDTAFDDTSTDKSKDKDGFNGDGRAYIYINDQQPGVAFCQLVMLDEQSAMPSSDTHRHNQNVLYNLTKGDLVEFPRGTYSHWGIYAGNQRIIHLVADEEKKIIINGVSRQLNNCKGPMAVSGAAHAKAGGSRQTKGEIRDEDFFAVAEDSKAMKNNQLDHKYRVYTPDEIVRRAMSEIGRTDYDLFTNNCEHFATWCRYGIAISLQAMKGAEVVETADTVTTGFTVFAGVVGFVAAAAGIGVTLLKLL